MARRPSVSVVNERFLAEGVERLAAAIAGSGELLDVFDAFVRRSSDDELVRINPVSFGRRRGLPTAAVVERFLHAQARAAHDGMAVRLPRLRRDRRTPTVAHLRHGPLLLRGLQRRTRSRSERLQTHKRPGADRRGYAEERG